MFNKFIIFLFVIAAGVTLGLFVDFELDSVLDRIKSFPPYLSGLVFILVYVLSTTFIWLGPKDILRVTGAILFGGFISTIWIYIAELINAVILFFLARKYGHDYVFDKLNTRKTLSRAKNELSYIGIMAIRINPVFPFRLIDLGYGLSDVKLKKYFLAIALASPLRIFWLQTILAKTGEAYMNNPIGALSELTQDPFLLMLSGGYFLCIVILTLVTIILRYFRLKS